MFKQKLPFILSAMFFGLFIAKGAYCQSVSDRIISGDSLSWAYYSIKSDSDSSYWANTVWAVYYKYKIVSFRFDTVKVELQTTRVLKGESWVLREKQSDELLRHEQVHFNMGILFELEFKYEVASTTLFIDDYGQKVDSVFNAVLKNIMDLNVEYDNETHHMWNKSKQQLWKAKIEEKISKARNTN